jgi:tRNA-dihydrouridine synthase
MIGRGIFSNPWLFNPAVDVEQVSIPERTELFLHHIDLFSARWGGKKNFANLKKFAKTYINSFPESAKLREELMLAKSIEELRDILRTFLLH